jgi:hypothetical protein
MNTTKLQRSAHHDYITSGLFRGATCDILKRMNLIRTLKKFVRVYSYVFNAYQIEANFNRRLFATTLTELNAIAAPAIIGSSRNPFTG